MSKHFARAAKVYNIQVKTHKMSIVHSGLPPTAKIRDIKEETLSALQAKVAKNALDISGMDPPEIDVQTVDDFELCRAIKEKGLHTGDFEVLAASKTLRDSGISGWEAVFLQFRDRETANIFISFLNKYLGKLLPITYTLPPMNEDEREVPVSQNTDIKGKRRASVELDESTLDF